MPYVLAVTAKANMSPALANFLGWAVVVIVVAGILGFFVKILKGNG